MNIGTSYILLAVCLLTTPSPLQAWWTPSTPRDDYGTTYGFSYPEGGTTAHPTPPTDDACHPSSRPVTVYPGSVITSPNFPENYPNNALCEWIIKAEPEYFAGLVFTDFWLEGPSSCPYDRVDLHDGQSDNESLIARLCASRPVPDPWSASGQDMFVRFSTDGSVTYSGFRAIITQNESYWTKEPEPTQPGPQWTTQGPLDEACNSSTMPVTKYPGDIITTPNYPGNYPNNALCQWILEADPGNVSGIVFTDFELEGPVPQCFYDWVDLHDGPSTDSPLIASLCGYRNVPDPWSATGRHMFVNFSSDHIVTYRGFRGIVVQNISDYTTDEPHYTTDVPSVPEITTTKRPPSQGTPPRYKLALWGNFSSSTGEPFSGICTAAYGTKMTQNVDVKIPDLNQMIGDSLCEGLNGMNDLRIVFSNTQFITDEDTGYTVFTYWLELDIHVTFENVYSCADELSEYLQDFDHWSRPIIPPEDGCPVVVFDPQQFIDGRTSTVSDWDCSDTLKSERQGPLYVVHIFDDFEVQGQEPLDIDCTNKYSLSWQREVTQMSQKVNNSIAGGSLCAGSGGTVTVKSATSGFIASGLEGLASAFFYMHPSDPAATFDEVHACAADVTQYVLDHDNWGQGPIIPPEPGCHLLSFGERFFYEGNHRWECFD